jgi:hypothetical protein
MLVKFKVLNIERTERKSYYKLTKKSIGNNRLVGSINWQQLDHHDWLVKLAIKSIKAGETVQTSREIMSLRKIGDTRFIPDLIYESTGNNSAIVEYERTKKNNSRISDSLYKRLVEGGVIFVICETQEIKNAYENSLKEIVEKYVNQNNKDQEFSSGVFDYFERHETTILGGFKKFQTWHIIGEHNWKENGKNFYNQLSGYVVIVLKKEVENLKQEKQTKIEIIKNIVPQINKDNADQNNLQDLRNQPETGIYSSGKAEEMEFIDVDMWSG